jgi:Tfp pilus assembly protein PilF
VWNELEDIILAYVDAAGIRQTSLDATMRYQLNECPWRQRPRVLLSMRVLMARTCVLILGVCFVGLIIRVDPDPARACGVSEHAWSGEQDLDKIVADLDQAIRLKPEDASLYVARGDAWTAKQEFEKAIADYGQAIRLDARLARAYKCRGYAWDQKQEYDKAIVDFTEAIRLDPKDGGAYGSRGAAWFRKKRYDKAIADFTEVIRLDPQDAAAYYVRGYSWSEKKEHDKAIADFTEAIRLDPEAAHAYFFRAYAWGQKQEYDKAIADFTEAIRLDPGEFHAYNGIAWFLATCPDARFRDGKRAVASATKACELTAWKQHAPLNTLAAAHAEAGDFESAVKWQLNAIALLNDKEKKDEYRSRLKLYQEKKPYREPNP